MPVNKVLLRTGKRVSQDVFDKTFSRLEALKMESFDDLERLYNYLQMKGFDYRHHTKALRDRGWDFIASDGVLTADQVDIILACIEYKKGRATFVDPKQS